MTKSGGLLVNRRGNRQRETSLFLKDFHPLYDVFKNIYLNICEVRVHLKVSGFLH